MKSRAGVWLFFLISITAPAGEFRRIETIDSVDRGGRLVLEDWDGDGDLELLRGSLVFEYDSGGMAGRFMTLTQIFEVSNGAWATRHGFIHRFSQLYHDAHYRVKRDEVKYTIDGDFNADGVVDALVAEPGSASATEGGAAEIVLRLKQSGKVLFEDRLDGVYAGLGLGGSFNRFELRDLDGDGIDEILVWALSYRDSDRLFVYGNDQSKWRGNSSNEAPYELNEALQFLKGIRAARPELPCPVEVKMEALKDSEYPSFSYAKVPWAKRFKLTFNVRTGYDGVNLTEWRDYFQKWAIAYTRERGSESRSTPTRSSWGLYMVPEGDRLLAAIGARESRGKKPEGWHDFWLECAFVGAESKPFNWIGTLRTEEAMARIDYSSQAEGGAK
ncbi:MAG: VCBS repeat-containing protein [Candidatus Hydrogenedentes bacterium]|nr:VCBS repeat-containing protein [Candidatus Hydrogenedentota bacterium]